MQQPEHTSAESIASSSTATETSSDSLFDYLLIILKHKKMIFGVTFLVAVATALFSLTLSNIYTAKTMILPGDEDKGMMGAMLAQLGGLAGVAGGALGGTTKADLYVTILKSEAVKDQLIDRFKLMELFKVKYRSYAYKRLDAISKIAAGKKDGVITISVDNKDPKMAAALANGYVDELSRLAARLGMTGAGKNRVFLEKRLAEAKADLTKAEDDLKSFQARNKAISLPDQIKGTFDGLAQLRAQLALQEVQLGTLQRQFTDNSQEVKSAKAAVAQLRGQISTLEGKGGSSSTPNLGNMPQLGQEYLRLMREFKIQEAVLEILTKQYEMVKINELKDVSPIQVIQKANVPDRKSKPARSKIVVKMAFFTGILLIALAFLKEHNRQMQTEERKQVEHVLAALPQLFARVWRWLVA